MHALRGLKFLLDLITLECFDRSLDYVKAGPSRPSRIRMASGPPDVFDEWPLRSMVRIESVSSMGTSGARGSDHPTNEFTVSWSVAGKFHAEYTSDLVCQPWLFEEPGRFGADARTARPGGFHDRTRGRGR